MSNIFQEAKWQFRFDPAGSLFFASLFVLFLVLVVVLFLVPFAPASKPEGDDCCCYRQERIEDIQGVFLISRGNYIQ